MRRLRLRLRFPRRDRSHSTKLHHAHLPPELILYTLQKFVPRQPEESPGVRGNAHRTLYNVALVCHSWHQVGVELLYGNVVLPESRSLDLFIRTIESSPALAGLVKSMSMIDVQEDLVIANALDCSDPMSVNAFYVPQTTISSLNIAFKTCENLTFLSVAFSRSVPFYTRGKDIMSGPTWRTSRLRMLSLSGSALEIMLTHFALPLLEVLCLRDFEFSGNIRFHQLKRLHTLRLYQPFRRGTTRPIDIASFQTVFPNLRTYELYKDGPSTPLIDIGIFNGIPKLEHASFVECPTVRKFELVKGCDTLRTLRSFTLGVIHGDRDGSLEDSFATWRLPPSLETLTLLIGVPRGGAPPVYPLDIVVQLLRHNIQPHTPFPLRKLKLGIQSTKRNDSPLPSYYLRTLDTITDLCKSVGIVLEMTQIDFSYWIAGEMEKTP
ncbi:hypothetical protein NLI96_g640 [Meripilus lineatus]|uniref:F-box domain-containing protein n=1 Tax=Meripilus lineatus TaxID=2056292 RepID=A0AAD5YNQ1_9APHY|nr:hypothetical protein NLI96_g640 [Physisporinus lineatus]